MLLIMCILLAQPPKAPPVAAAEPELIGLTQYDYMAEFKVRNVPNGTAVIWDVYPDDKDTISRVVKVERACFVAGPPREYTVKVRLVKGEDVVELKKTFRLLHPARPPPTPVDPPGPVDPPVPVPVVPIPELGFRVLIVYDDKYITSDYTPAQRYAIKSTIVRKYLEDKCVQGPLSKEYRIWDVKTKGVENESTIWQKAFARPRTMVLDNKPVPWIVVSNGKDGFEGPIPATWTMQDIDALLKKYGG